MKKNKKIGLFCLLSGIGLFVFNILNIDYVKDFNTRASYHYEYTDSTKILISFGVILIIIGTLIVKKNNK